MKVLAFNGSPKRDKGTTAKILNPFLKGIKDAGGEYELFHVRDLEIFPCKECTSSPAFQSEGKCYCNDDMNKLYPKLREADSWLFAAPNYLNSFPGQMKHLMDRLEPLFPFKYSLFDDSTPDDHEIQNKKIIMMATATQWEADGFSNMEFQLQALASMFNSELVASITRPHADALMYEDKLIKSAHSVVQSCYNAGIEFVKNGLISKQTISEISKPIISRNSFLNEISMLIGRSGA